MDAWTRGLMDSWTHGLMGSYEKLELYYNCFNGRSTKQFKILSFDDTTTPLTNMVRFKYVTTFNHLSGDIDNTLEKLEENVVKQKKIRKKIAIWRKLNLSTL